MLKRCEIVLPLRVFTYVNTRKVLNRFETHTVFFPPEGESHPYKPYSPPR